MPYSKYDENGSLSVDCTECTKGYNGYQTCASGARVRKGNFGSCFYGKPFKFIKSRLEKNKLRNKK